MKHCFLLLFTISQIFSHAQQQKDYINKWECETSKQELVETKLYEKKYYGGKLIQNKNLVSLKKDFNVYFENIDNDTIVNFHIDIQHTIKGEVTDKKFNSFYSNSMRKVYQILKDLQYVIHNKNDECHFNRYYFEINYEDNINAKVYSFLYWLEQKQLEDYLNHNEKKKLYRILEVQTDE